MLIITHLHKQAIFYPVLLIWVGGFKNGEKYASVIHEGMDPSSIFKMMSICLESC